MRRLALYFVITLIGGAQLSGCSSPSSPTSINAKLGAPGALDFGSVKVGQHRDTSVRFTNTGTDSLVISNQLFSPSSFRLADSTQSHLTIAPGGYQDVSLRFQPFDGSSVSGEDSIVTNVGSSSIKLTGGGVALTRILQLPASINFADTRMGLCEDTLLGAPRDTLVSIQNTGNDTLRILSVTASAPYAATFTQAIAPGNSGWLRIRFCPSQTGAKASSVTILTNATKDSVQSVSLSGTGIRYTPGIGSIYGFANYTIDSLQKPTFASFMSDTVVSTSATSGGQTGLTQFSNSNQNQYTRMNANGDLTIFSNGVPTGKATYFGSGWWTIPTGTRATNVILFDGDTTLANNIHLKVHEAASYNGDTVVMISGRAMAAEKIVITKTAIYGPGTNPNYQEGIEALFVPEIDNESAIVDYIYSPVLNVNRGFARLLQSFNLK